MRFWDSSALVPLLIREATSERLCDLLRKNSGIALWWCTPVECAGALARIHREGKLRLTDLQRAQDRLGSLRENAFEIQALERIREHAHRLVAKHRLRAADALQLGAALVWYHQLGGSTAFVCLDDRLRLVAAIEGFLVMPYAEGVHERAFDDFDD